MSVIGISRLTIENRFIDHFKRSTEIYQALEVFYPQLDKIEGELHNMIHGIRSRQRDAALPVQRTRRDPLGLFRT